MSRSLPLLLILFACGTKTTATQTTATQSSAAGPRVIFPDGTRIDVEIASDDATRAQGLMYRDHLADDRGMVFLFNRTGSYPFWMKNTLIPLDIIWLDDQKRIVHIGASVPPCKADPCPSYDPGTFARYVLEVAGGVAGRHHLATGQTLRFEAMDNVVVR
jgi:uncharacterized membrane protein (UPF0127 family)